jgi:hypothetical protein
MLSTVQYICKGRVYDFKIKEEENNQVNIYIIMMSIFEKTG